MRLRSTLCLATLFLTCFALAAWSTPVPDRLAPSDRQPLPDTQSVSGKISSIEDAAFALEVAKGKDVSTVHFLVDDQTRVEGKLEVGSQATVEYRSNGGKNIAVHVVVLQSSGMSSY
jgi:hypothetical protein